MYSTEEVIKSALVNQRQTTDISIKISLTQSLYHMFRINKKRGCRKHTVKLLYGDFSSLIDSKLNFLTIWNSITSIKHIWGSSSLGSGHHTCFMWKTLKYRKFLSFVELMLSSKALHYEVHFIFCLALCNDHNPSICISLKYISSVIFFYSIFRTLDLWGVIDIIDMQ